VKHITIRPYFSRSNRLVEIMNQTIKSSLAKAKQSNQSFYDVISNLRSKPVGDGLPSPSEWHNQEISGPHYFACQSN